MEKTADVTVEKVSENLRALADLIEAIENKQVTPEIHEIADRIDLRSLTPELQTVIRLVGGTAPESLDYMNADFRAVLQRTWDQLHED